MTAALIMSVISLSCVGVVHTTCSLLGVYNVSVLYLNCLVGTNRVFSVFLLQPCGYKTTVLNFVHLTRTVMPHTSNCFSVYEN